MIGGLLGVGFMGRDEVAVGDGDTQAIAWRSKSARLVDVSWSACILYYNV